MLQRNRPILVTAVLLLAMAAAASAHCDTMNGPVVTAARAALEKGELAPVLKWIKAEHEDEVRAAFALSLKVRAGGDDARELADRSFFETVVRLHRQGEGAPYTGLKPAGDPGLVVRMADGSIESGSAERIASAFAAHLHTEIAARHARVAELHRHADESAEAGRAFVAAYVEYVHYLEHVHAVMTATAGAEAHQH